MSQSPFGTPAPAAVPPLVQPAEDAPGGGRRRLLLLGGAGVAGLVVAGGVALALLSGGDAPVDEGLAPPLPAATAPAEQPAEEPGEEPAELPTEVQFNDRNPFHADVVQSSGASAAPDATGAAAATGSATAAPSDAGVTSGTTSGTTTGGTTGATTGTSPGTTSTVTGERGPRGPRGAHGHHGHHGHPGEDGEDGEDGKDGEDGEDAVLPVTLTFLGHDGADRARFALDYGTADEVLVSVAAGEKLERDAALPGSDITYVGGSGSGGVNARVRLAGDPATTYTLVPGRPRLLRG